MGEWHEHLGEPLKYEDDEAVARYEENPWAQSAHKAEPTAEKPTTLDECLKLSKLLAKHFPPGLIVRMAVALETAEQKHPVFAEGPYQGIARITEELGECVQCLNHGDSMERLESEAMDVLVTAIRFVRGDWKIQGSAK